MLVQNKGKYVRHRGTVRVLPGVNNMKSKDWNHFKAHKMNAALIKKGEIVALEGEEGTVEEESLKITDIDAKDAIEVVNDTFSLDLLKEFKADEQAAKKRSTVLKAIEDQIKELTEEPGDNQEGGE